MRKYLLLIAAICCIKISFAASEISTPSPKPVYAADIKVPIGKTGLTISLLDLSEINVNELQQLTGEKMSVANKLMFKKAQKQLRASINEDGTVNNKKLLKHYKPAAGTDGFHVGGFLLGLFVGLIGILIAYLINDEKKKKRVKWAWIGLIVWAAIWLLVLII
jgi:hypothetical protein